MTFAQDHMDAINEGIEKGIAIGEIKTLIKLVRKGLLSLKDASEQAAMSEKEFSALLAAK